MFCPQCGQQSSDEIRFCPRCGVSLAPPAALLATVNATAQDPGGAPAPARSAKRNAARRGAKLMFFSVALFFPLFLILSIMTDAGELLLFPFVTFLVGLFWWSYVKLFVDDATHVTYQPSRADLKAAGEKPALGAAQFVPASAFKQQRANTAEIVRPPSVTEHTTKLLDKDS